MKAYELAELLMKGPNMEVHVGYPAGDYWRTTLTQSVVQVAQAEVAPSTYHQCDVLVEDDNNREGQHTVIVLR